MNMLKSWQDHVMDRFSGREELTKEELYRRFWMGEGLLQDSVFDALDLIEREFSITAGVLRPDDKLAKLFVPPATKNPLKWLYYQYVFGDRHDWLDTRIAEKLKEHALVREWTQESSILTVDDYVRAWCGRPPLMN